MIFSLHKPEILSFRPEPGRRILVISDIHGNLAYFKGVLEKASFCADDYLILNGDFIEKGENSLDTLRYIISLSRAGNVIPVRGNCDGWADIFGYSGQQDIRLRAYLSGKRRGLIKEMCAELGLNPVETDTADLKRQLLEAFPEEWEYLRHLPDAVETERFIFAHAGVNPEKPLSENTAEELEHTDEFLRRDVRFDRWVIVGHWPVMLYSENIVTANPVIDSRKRIVSLDGACVLKDDGQLNCLIIPDRDSEDFSWVSYDGFPVKTAASDQIGGGQSYYIRWGDSRVRVLERGEEFSHCRHIRTGYEMDILTRYLFSGGEETDCNDCTDYVLPVKAGDRLSVVETTSRGYFVKLDGISGWYYGELI